MLLLPLCIFYLTSSFVTPRARAWGATYGNEETPMQKWDPEHHGKVVFISESGTMTTDPSLSFDENEGTIKMDRFAANSYWGDSINFRGREIRNAALVNPSMEGLNHLTVDSLALRTLSSPGKTGFELAIIDGNGGLSTTKQMRWDEKSRELKVSALSSFSKSGLEIRSDIDFMANKLKNVNIEKNTTLNELVFRDGYIENSVLHNITATGLTLGDVEIYSLSISRFDLPNDIGSFVFVGDGGALQVSSDLKKGKDGRLLIDSEVALTKPIDVNGNDMLNVNVKSGTINGNIEVKVDIVDAKGICITDIRDDKTITTDGLAILGLDGKLKMSPISIDGNGRLGDMNVRGKINFVRDGDYKGEIRGALISDGEIKGIEKLNVIGETDLRSGLQVSGETYIDGALTVSGSVLGSGPYVDVSDRRFKKHIEAIKSEEALNKILQLEGVSYELDIPENHRLGKSSNSPQRRQLGLIAQEVEEIIPEVVDTDKDGFKGIQYSRLAPLLIEGFKQLADEVRRLQAMNAHLLVEQDKMAQKIDSLIGKAI